MNCWKCHKEMVVEFDNPWRVSKQGDWIRTTTWVCWECKNIARLQATEVKEDDICDDDVPEEVH